MAEDKIDSIIDRAAISNEIAFLQGEVNKVVAIIKATKDQSIKFNVDTKTVAEYNKGVEQLNASMVKMQQTVAGVTAATAKNTQATQQANGTLAQNIELRRRLQTTLDSYNQDQKEDLALLKAGTITRAEYNKRISESSVKAAIYKARIQELNRVIKEDVALSGKAGDAYKQLSAEYNRAALAAKNYQLTLGKTHPTTIEAVKRAKDLSNQLKDVDNAVGQNGRNVGNYSNAITKAAGNTFSAIRKIANILPGLGISGVFLLIGNSIGTVLSSLNLFNNRLDDTARKTKILSDITEEASKNVGKESAELKILRASIESTEVPMATRLQGVKDLRELYPDYFKDLTDEQILTGQVADAYDLAALAILRKARASAAASQIEQNATKQFKIEQEILKDVEETNKRIRSATADADESGVVINTQKEVQQILRDAFKNRQKLRDQELADIKKDNDFLLQIAVAGAKETIKIDKAKEERKKKAPKERDLAEADRKARFEILKAQIELDKEFDLKRAADEKRTFEDRVLNIISFGEDSQRLIDAQAAFELGAAKLTATERKKIELDKNNALIRLAEDLNTKLKAIVRDDFTTGTAGLGESVKGMTEGFAKGIAKYRAELKKLEEDTQKKEADRKKAIKDAALTLSSELQGLTFDLFQNALERQKNAIQDQIDLLEQQKQKEIEVANQTITNANDRADAIAVIEARAAAKRQQLELRQRQLDQQKARFEKANAVTRIIQETAVAIISSFKTDPTGILAAIIGAIGAAQLVRVIAQPIPRYAEGTEGHKGGPAIVGDGGRAEGVVLPDGSVYKTPSTDTLVNLPAGTKVYPDYDKMMLNASMTKTPVFAIKSTSDTAVFEKVGKDIVRAVKSIPQPILKSEGAWTRAMRNGSNFRQYLNKNL